MYIKKVEIKNIRSIDHFEMTFSEPAGWHVLIGDNGSGKTTILRAIALALIGSEQAAGLRADWKDWLRKGQQNGEVVIDLERDIFYDQPSYFGVLDVNGEIPSPSHTFKNYVKLTYSDNAKTVKLESHIDDYIAKYRHGHSYNWDTNYFWFSASFGPFRRFTGGSEEWKEVFNNDQLSRLIAHLTLFNESVALTETTGWLMKQQFQKLEQKNNHLDAIKELVNSINFLPGNTKLREVSSEGVTFIDGDGLIIPINQLSDGFRSILSLTFELLRLIIDSHSKVEIFKKTREGEIFVTTPGVVLIDEIDAHLHPTWQTRIGEWFTKYFPNIQFIVTTHSPLICRACEKGSIWRLADPGSEMKSGEITGIDKDKLIYGNILDAYGTEVFGKSPVRSVQSDEKRERLGKLNMLFALNKINKEEEKERLELQKILSTDDPTGF